MGPSRFPPVLVGVDGTDLADAAARAGVDEAERRLLPVRLVRAVDRAAGAAARRVADEHLRRLRTALLPLSPGTPVDAAVVEGRPVEVLLAEAARAGLLVLGAHRARPSAGALGPVRAPVLRRCPRPVLCAAAEPPRVHRSAPVVAVVDDDDPARAELLLRTAAMEASTRDTDLAVVDLRRGTGLPATDLPATVARLRPTAPAVPMRLVGPGARLPGPPLVRDAQLLVVGRGDPRRPLAGPARAALTQSQVPVLLVPVAVPATPSPPGSAPGVPVPRRRGAGAGTSAPAPGAR